MIQQFRCGNCGKRFADIDIVTGWIKVAGAHYNKGKKCTAVNELTFKDGELVEHKCEVDSKQRKVRLHSLGAEMPPVRFSEASNSEEWPNMEDNGRLPETKNSGE